PQILPAVPATDADRIPGDRRRHGLALYVDSQRLLPAGRYRPALGLDRGARGHFLPGDGGAAAAGSRRIPSFAIREKYRQRRWRRWRFRQQRAPVRGAEAQERAAQPPGRPRRIAPATAADRRHRDLHDSRAEPPAGRPLLPQPVSIRAAGGGPEYLVPLG